MCTASRIDRMNQQRLRRGGMTAPSQPGSFGQDPWVLRPKRLRWLAYAKSLAPAEIAALHNVASAHHHHSHLSTAARAEVMAGASPPFILSWRDHPS
jgi:hypothetical protein